MSALTVRKVACACCGREFLTYVRAIRNEDPQYCDEYACRVVVNRVYGCAYRRSRGPIVFTPEEIEEAKRDIAPPCSNCGSFECHGECDDDEDNYCSNCGEYDCNGSCEEPDPEDEG